MNKQRLLQFARLLKMMQEITTDRGVLISDGDIVVGSEVYINNADGELEVAVDGTYETEGLTITVEAGKVTAIEEKAVEEPIEPETKPETEELEETPVEETPVDENAENENTEDVNAELEEANARIAELEAQLAEANAKIAELEAKLAEPVADPIEDFSINEKDKKAKTKLNALAEAFKKNN